jgi:hypothetical protein
MDLVEREMLRKRYIACVTAAAAGRNAYFVVVAWIAGSYGPTFAAGLLAAGSIAEFLTTNLGGVIVDRFNRRLTCLVCDVLRAVIVGLTALGLLNAPTVPVLAFSLVIYTVVDRTYLAAMQAMIPSLVAAEQLIAFNSMSYIAMQFGNLFAAIVAGLLLVLIPREYCPLIAVGCFGLSFCVMLSGRWQKALPANNGHLTGLNRADVLPTALPAGPLRLYALGYGLIYAMGILITVLASALVIREFRGSALDFGYLEAGWAAGSAAGCLYLLFRITKLNALILHLMLSGCVLAAFLVMQNLAAGLVQVVALGISYNVARVLVDVRVQRSVPGYLLGRTRSQIHTVCVAVGLAAYCFVAIAGNNVMPSAIFGFFGLVMVAGGILIFVMQRGGPIVDRPI